MVAAQEPYLLPNQPRRLTRPESEAGPGAESKSADLARAARASKAISAAPLMTAKIATLIITPNGERSGATRTVPASHNGEDRQDGRTPTGSHRVRGEVHRCLESERAHHDDPDRMQTDHRCAADVGLCERHGTDREARKRLRGSLARLRVRHPPRRRGPLACGCLECRVQSSGRTSWRDCYRSPTRRYRAGTPYRPRVSEWDQRQARSARASAPQSRRASFRRMRLMASTLPRGGGPRTSGRRPDLTPEMIGPCATAMATRGWRAGPEGGTARVRARRRCVRSRRTTRRSRATRPAGSRTARTRSAGPRTSPS